jgi:hypothetical protein
MDTSCKILQSDPTVKNFFMLDSVVAFDEACRQGAVGASHRTIGRVLWQPSAVLPPI